MASIFNDTLTGRTMLFPCAAGVQMPQIGANDTKIKVTNGRSPTPSMLLPMTIVPQDANPVNSRYVKMVSNGMSFAQEVVEDRCLHMMPFSEKYFEEVFNPGAFVPAPKKTTQIIGRHDKRGTDIRHMPCYLKKIAKPLPLTPLRKQVKEKAHELHKQALLDAQLKKEPKKGKDPLSQSASSFFLTETVSESTLPSQLKPIPEGQDGLSKKEETKMKKEVKLETSLKPERRDVNKSGNSTFLSIPKSDQGPVSRISTITETDEHGETKEKRGDWDDHLMSRLSQLTANWIVHERTPGDKQKTKLSQVLGSWYGAPTHTDLVREEMSDGEEEEKEKDKKPKKKWKKKEASLLARVYNITPPPGVALDPYSDDNQAPFYRQPAGIRKKKRSEEKEEAGSINATAHNILIKELSETSPPKLTDFLSPRVGRKVYNTDNLFQQEQLIGNKQLYTRGDPAHIYMESKNKYQKHLQREMPPRPETWYLEQESDVTNDDARSKSVCGPKVAEKGHKRWAGLPEPVDDTANVMKATAPGFDPVYTKPVDPKQRRKVKQNSALMTIVNEWRSKWFVSGQFADSTPQDLIKDMADIQAHVRLKAIGTVAKATEYKPPQDDGVLLEGTEPDTAVELPEEIFVALECLLDDSHLQVRKTAAITLYSLDRPTDKAKERLREMLFSQSGVDRWAAAQCLAHYGECDSDVVAEIIRQILNCEGAIKYEQGIQLLAKISNSSTLVHCMVAEQLNSSSWRHRVIACKIIPTLFGSINRDIAQKLSQLMWHDWHVEVRNAAAQCLGKTSHGRDVHNDIRERILDGSERTKLEAINKLGQLGIMTAKLLPAFLECFADPYVSIRCEVCITCGNLQIKEEQVLNRLIHLATFDPIWKVKALAIQALGRIGEVTEDIKESLLWAMRYEEKEGVRAEACHSLVALGVQDDEVLDALQERLLVESSSLVREEMIEALSQFGLSTSEDMDMVAQIKSEVRKLCTRNIIASQILVNETDEARREQLARMVCQTEEDIEALNQKKAVILRRIRSQARSIDSRSSSAEPRTSTPVPKVKIGSDSTSPEVISREVTIFTPTADKELEAILSNQEDEADSRPITGASGNGLLKQISEVEKEEGAVEEDQDVGQAMPATVTFLTNEDDDVKDKRTDSTTKAAASGGDNTTPAVKHQLDVPQLPTLTQNQIGGFLSPAVSMREPAGSRLSTSQFSGRRSILSRDSMKERQRLNAQVSAIYSGLDARYAGMISDLCRIDRGLDTKGSSAASSTDTSLNNAVMSRSHIQAAHAQIEAILSRTSNLKDGEDTIENQNVAATTGEGDTADQAKASGEQDGNQTQENMTEDGGKQTTQSLAIDLETVGNCEGDEQRKNEDHQMDKDDADVEWKSFADTLSKDGGENVSFGGSTSYPSFEDDPDDPNVARSYVSTAGLTAQASEYDNNSVVSDNDLEEDLEQEGGVLKIY
ncbi:heat repeat-containing protein 4 [Plakobranchus ocellatus]|uniref:Heat repeat-containing protein 4 n=1 Tax=Plakobranchus ocellatus TaxID=259542 RepID=A0AAV3Z981_9GAST|nr:heat repeat-containing protein 4 [Plakobranchus ocellatus]